MERGKEASECVCNTNMFFSPLSRLYSETFLSPSLSLSGRHISGGVLFFFGNWEVSLVWSLKYIRQESTYI